MDWFLPNSRSTEGPRPKPAPMKLTIEVTLNMRATTARQFLQYLGGLLGVLHVRLIDEVQPKPPPPQAAIPPTTKLLDV